MVPEVPLEYSDTGDIEQNPEHVALSHGLQFDVKGQSTKTPEETRSERVKLHLGAVSRGEEGHPITSLTRPRGRKTSINKIANPVAVHEHSICTIIGHLRGVWMAVVKQEHGSFRDG